MRTDAHLLLQELQNYNSLLKTIDRRMLDPTKKDTSCPGTKNKPQKDGRRGKITFRVKTHILQRHSEGSNKTLGTPGDPTEPEPDLCLSVSCGGTGQQWPAAGARALGAADLGMA